MVKMGGGEKAHPPDKFSLFLIQAGVAERGVRKSAIKVL